MLLRPLFLKLIDQVLSIKPAQSANSDLSYFNDACLRAARDNLKLLIGLWQVGKVGKLSLVIHDILKESNIISNSSNIWFLGELAPFFQYYYYGSCNECQYTATWNF